MNVFGGMILWKPLWELSMEAVRRALTSDIALVDVYNAYDDGIFGRECYCRGLARFSGDISG